MQFLGFVPGDDERFGWAVVTSIHGALHFAGGGICSDAMTAIEHTRRHLIQAPAAIGIGAPLHWAWKGERFADVAVRHLVRNTGGHSSTVNDVNSMRGARLVQGILLASLARTKWPRSMITESHPKAMLHVCAEARVFVDRLGSIVQGEHVRDAALGAFAAHAFTVKTPGWYDLAALEQSPFDPGNVEARYWFPAHGRLAVQSGGALQRGGDSTIDRGGRAVRPARDQITDGQGSARLLPVSR